MSFGIIGRKLGMTQLFDATGNVDPVTVLEVGPCVVLEVLARDPNGYSAVKLGYEETDEKSLNRPGKGYFKKIGRKPVGIIREFRVGEPAPCKPGDTVDASIFKAKDLVDVVGISKGKG